MKILLAILLNFIFLSEALCYEATVIKITDGDTLIVENQNGKRVKLRLYGIDCPEKRQLYGVEALEKTLELTLNAKIRVVQIAKDKYSRTVAGIIMIDNLMVLQNELVSRGLAWVDDRFCKLEVCKTWKMHQSDAQKAQRGLWQELNPVAPWSYRKMKKDKKND